MLNYGFAKNWEAVGEFRVEASPEFEITDPGLFLKSVLKEGMLQEKEGVSFAIEAGRCCRRPFLTSMASESRRSVS